MYFTVRLTFCTPFCFLILLCLIQPAVALGGQRATSQRPATARRSSSTQSRQAQPSPLFQEAYRQAEAALQAATTKCGDSHYNYNSTTIYQYKDVVVSLNESRLTEADRLNGIEWSGSAHFDSKVWRTSFTSNVFY